MGVEAVGPEEFRRALAQFASGLTVVTTFANGHAHGTTVSAFSSVSLDPPLVLVCLHERSTTVDRAVQTGRFAVNILSEAGEPLARHFAGRGPKSFSDIAFQEGRGGIPLLEDSVAVLECRVHERIAAGDHVILVGLVEVSDVRQGQRPLVYFEGSYHAL